jgi:hypothetical protein
MEPPVSDDSQWMDLFSALSNPYRRQLLVALLEHNPQDDDDQDPLDILADGQEGENLPLKMIHQHLPKLEEMGFIEWDRQTSEISKGPNWDEIAPVLTLIHEHRDELPDGWLESEIE